MDMQELEHGQPSTGIYYEHSLHGSGDDLHSAALRDHAAPVAGASTQNFQQTGVPVGGGAAVGAGAAGSGGASGNAPTRKPWYKRRNWIIAQVIGACVGIALIFIVLWPVVAAIAQAIVNKSVLNIQTAAIGNPTNDSFLLTMTGTVTHTGIFNADIMFSEPLSVAWKLDNGTEVPLGSMDLAPLSAKHKIAYLNQSSQFNISNQDAFGEFTAYMITQPNFTWVLSSNNLKVQADKFPEAHGLHFNKVVTLNGINSFGNNTVLEEFQMPGDHAGGGIDFVAVTGLNNTSPFVVDLGTVVFDLYYDNMFLGSGTGQNTKISPGANNISLSGFLVPQSGAANLSTLSTLFTNYLNSESSSVIAVGISTQQSDGSSISWLSKGLQGLKLTVPFMSQTPINAIHSIGIGSMTLDFTEETAWAPLANSNSVQAALQLPFGFSISIDQIENSFNISQNGSTVAGLTTPLGASTSSIQVLGQSNTQGTINISITNSNLVVPSANHEVFSLFNTQLTSSKQAVFQLEGHSHALANLSVGQLTLDPINFNVTSRLDGLNGLQGDTVITGVDVLGGTTTAINLAINVSIYNPSNLNLHIGDLELQLYRNGSLLGTTLMPNLTLNIGNNSVSATSDFEPNNSPAGLDTLNKFVAGQNVQLQISGYSGSTNVSSLQEAFETLNIDATLPASTTPLLQSAALQVLNSTGHTNDVAQVTVDLVNAFNADLTITGISSSVMSHGIALGTINVSTNFQAPAKKTTTSPTLDFAMNLDPSALFTVTRALAVDAGEDPAPLDGIVQLGGISYITATTADTPKRDSTKRQNNLYTNFNLVDFVDKAFKALLSDVTLTTDVMIGDYATTLEYTQTSVPTITDSSLNLLLPILAQPIVQKLVTGSLLGIDTVLIKNPTETSFDTELHGSITNAGPFDAIITFGQGLTISWAGKLLGSMNMPDVSLVGDVGATLNLTATFDVADTDHLLNFTKALLTEEFFDWDIAAEGLSVAALGIAVPGINLTTKTVTLKGMNGLKGGVKINSFDLPANDPAGGIHLTLSTTVANPSQVGMELSSIGFENYFEGTDIGPVASSGGFVLAAESSVDLPLVGRLIPQTSSDGLAAISAIFNNFVHAEDSNVTVFGASAGPSDVSWLNEGIKALQVEAILPNDGPLTIIKSISMDQLELLFTDDTAYNPATGSNDTSAAFTLPFAFPIDITALAQNITVGFGGQPIAELSIPKGPATTDVSTRIIHLTFSDIPFAVYDDQHSAFQQFLAATTVSQSTTFELSGAADTDAQTAVGLISLKGITFSVNTTIAGLQGLDAKPALISDLDVYHGYTDYLLIKVATSLFNPSNLTIGTGDVAFILQFEDTTIGAADVSSLIVRPGNGTYATDVIYSPQGDAIPVGQAMLENYIQGIISSTTILGSTDTTSIDSLKLALSELKLTPVNIPPLHQNLIISTKLEFPVDIVQTGIATVTFELSNPFTASVNLLELTSIATYEVLTLGEIDHLDLSSSPISADGHSNITSPSLPFKFNLEPTNIINLLELRSKEKGVDLGPLPSLFAYVLDDPSYKPSINTSVDTSPPTCVSGHQFDVDGAILDALAGMEVTLASNTVTKLDEYQTGLAFNQSHVPAITDDTALYLIGAVSPPIVQKLVDAATLTFTLGNITNVSNEGFDVALQGSLLNTGPLDALITFVEPVTVNWQGQDIALISLPPVCSAATTAVPDYRPNGHLTITNLDAFTSYATYLMHNPSFDWIISTDKLEVTALGTVFSDVVLSKSITLKAFNGLTGVTISHFELPSDNPAGGITIQTDSSIPSPAELGIELGTVEFASYFEDVYVGPLSGDDLFLAAETTTSLALSGRIVPQNSSSDLDTIGKLFSRYLAAENQTLTVKGVSVAPPGASSPVTWLNTAFQSLTLDVILPGQKFKVIQSIAIADLEVVMTTQGETYAPLASSKDTLATYANPFGFSLQVIQSADNITLGAGGVVVAQLLLPMSEDVGGISTGDVVDLPLSFQNQTLTSLNDDAFAVFFAGVTDTQSVAFELSGTADVLARTAIGDVPISALSFDVPSTLKGIDGFGGTATLLNTTVVGSGGNGGNQYLVSTLTTKMENPSNISLSTIDLALPVYYEGVMIGRAAMSPFDLVPGENTIATEFHYYPENANDTTAQNFLTEFVTSNENIPLTIQGDSSSSPFGSLVSALEGVKIETSVTGMGASILQHINVYISISTLLDNYVSINFDAYNPLDAPLTVSFVQADASIDGTIYAHFDQSFSEFTIPAKSSANSGTFGNVLLVEGAIASLPITLLDYLDIAAVQTAVVGPDGYEIPWLQVIQPGVPTTYTLDLGLIGLPIPALADLAQSLHASASSSQATSSTPAVSRSLPVGNASTPLITSAPAV